MIIDVFFVVYPTGDSVWMAPDDYPDQFPEGTRIYISEHNAKYHPELDLFQFS